MSDSKKQSNYFYTHSNNSTSSRSSHVGEMKQVSQVSNVDFTNLRRMSTSNSHVSESSNNTMKNNSLAKLFSKNKSSTTIQPDQFSSNERSEVSSEKEVSTDETAKVVGSRKSRKMPRLKLSSKKTHTSTPTSDHTTANETDNAAFNYTITTTTTAATPPPPPTTTTTTTTSTSSTKTRKMSIGSSVTSFHNLFHKPLTSSSSTKNEDKIRTDSSHTSPSKSAVGLSSNNSNSMITDPTLASMFRFTNANHSIEENEGTFDHGTLLELQRKMFTPADSYIQHKINKYHQQDIGLGITNEHDMTNDTEPDTADQIRFIKFHQRLSDTLRPLFIPQHKSDGNWVPSTRILGESVEDLGMAIKESFLDAASQAKKVGTISKQHKPRGKISKSGIKSHPQPIQITNETNHIVSNQYHVQPFVQELTVTLKTCMITLRGHFMNIQHSSYEEGTNSSLSFNHIPQDITHSWRQLSRCWNYFNLQIRFLVIGILHPLKVHFINDCYEHLPTADFELLDVDQLLLLAFDTTILRPFLRNRIATTNQLTNHFANITSLSDLFSSTEEEYFKNNPTICESLKNCFGTIQSRLDSTAVRTDFETNLHAEVLSTTVTNMSCIIAATVNS